MKLTDYLPILLFPVPRQKLIAPLLTITLLISNCPAMPALAQDFFRGCLEPFEYAVAYSGVQVDGQYTRIVC